MAELYIITGPEGKQYIGATKNTIARRFSGHVSDSKRTNPRGDGSYLQNAMRKYGAENFTVRTLLVGPRDLIFALEDYFIQSFGTRSPSEYNTVRGGSTGGDPSEEVRYRIGSANRGKAIHPNLQSAVKKHHAYRNGTEEYRESQRKACMAAWAKPGHREKMEKVLAKNNADPKIRKQRSQRMKKLRQDPEFNRRLKEAQRLSKQARLHNSNQLILL
jgi:group I intron endonuclease